MSSLKIKLIASYFGQAYVTLVGVLIAPLYVRYLGADGYGLIGLFTLLQSWMILLDVGFSATLARETARFGAGEGAPAEFRHLVDVLSRVFLVSGLVMAVAGVLASPWITLHWLKIGRLSPTEVMLAVAVMAVAVAVRWRTEPYRSILIGLERLVWLNAFNSAFATLRFVGAVLVLALVDASITAFFIYQLIVALLEAAVIVIIAYRLLPGRQPDAIDRRSTLATLRPLLKFALSVAFASTVWLMASQFDKLLLSTLLPLKAYGIFTLATLAAGGIGLLGTPISQVVMPRLTALYALKDEAGLQLLYRSATAFVTALVAPACLILVLFGAEVMWVWTGDQHVADQAYPILLWYALGNGLLAFTAFSYYLQYAHGDMRLHVRGNAVFALILVPAVVFAAFRFGAIGTGIVWFATNLVYLFGWTFLVHRRFAPGLHWRWLGRDIGLVSIPAILVLVGARYLDLPWRQNRMVDFVMLAILGLISLSLCAVLTPVGLATARRVFTPRRGPR
jgi:O-antigen/teichoic acid export membrane protein